MLTTFTVAARRRALDVGVSERERIRRRFWQDGNRDGRAMHATTFVGWRDTLPAMTATLV